MAVYFFLFWADTIPPTAYITASTSFTNALNVSVNISFSEPCSGGGTFGCSSVNTCNVSRCLNNIKVLSVAFIIVDIWPKILLVLLEDDFSSFWSVKYKLQFTLVWLIRGSKSEIIICKAKELIIWVSPRKFPIERNNYHRVCTNMIRLYCYWIFLCFFSLKSVYFVDQ